MFSTRPVLLTSSLLLISSVAFAQSPPVVSTGGNSGDDYGVDCNNVFSPGSAVTNVQMDGSASFDPDGTPVTFLWFEECPFGNFPDPTSATPIYVIDMTGVCSRTCVVALRVTSAGDTTVKIFSVTVQDATAPQISIPADVVGIWGDPTSTGATGMATSVDNCDAAPVVTFSDVIIPQAGPGTPEQIIQRTFVSTDCIGLSSSGMQTITLLSPSGGGGGFANLDFNPSLCPNVYSPLQTGNIDIVLLGSATFQVKDVVNSSIRLWVKTNPSVTILPSGFLSKDLGSITAVAYGDCNSVTLDGKKDLRLRFTSAKLAGPLGLGAYSSGQPVDLMITGKLKNGKLWATRDRLTIQ